MRNIVYILGFITFFSSAQLFAISTPLESKKIHTEILAGTGETFDDNVTLVKSNEKQDFITELSAGLRLSYEGERNTGGIQFEDFQQLFSSHHEFNNNAQKANASWETEITKMSSLKFTDDFSHGEEPRSFEDEFGRSRGRYSTSRNNSDLFYSHELSKRFTFNVGYGNQFNLFSRSDLRDSMRNIAKVSLDWGLNSESTLSWIYQYANYQFASSDTLGADSANSNGLGLGLKQYLSKQLYMNLGGGMDIIHNFSNDNLLRPYAEFGLTSEPDERTKIKLLSFEWRSQANPYQTSIFESWRVSGGITRELRKRLKGSLTGFFGSGEYKELDIHDYLYGTKAELVFEVRPELFLSLSYGFSITSSNQDSRDYSKNVTNLKLSYSI